MNTPWDDCKIAIGVDNADPFDDETVFENLCAGRGLPRGWVLDEVDGTGARWVAVFRVAGFPTAYAGKRVRSTLRAIGAFSGPPPGPDRGNSTETLRDELPFPRRGLP